MAGSHSICSMPELPRAEPPRPVLLGVGPGVAAVQAGPSTP
jgi:hypothetical protein